MRLQSGRGQSGAPRSLSSIVAAASTGPRSFQDRKGDPAALAAERVTGAWLVVAGGVSSTQGIESAAASASDDSPLKLHER
jgi:hypothetical protein